MTRSDTLFDCGDCPYAGGCLGKCRRQSDTLPKLEECPFCGGAPVLSKHGQMERCKPFYECFACNAFGPNGDTIEEAAANWNRRRPAPAPVGGVVEEAKKIVAEVTPGPYGLQSYGRREKLCTMAAVARGPDGVGESFAIFNRSEDARAVARALTLCAALSTSASVGREDVIEALRKLEADMLAAIGCGSMQARDDMLLSAYETVRALSSPGGTGGGEKDDAHTRVDRNSGQAGDRTGGEK